MRLTRYAVAAVLARLADEGARVALVLLALERTGSAAAGAGAVARRFAVNSVIRGFSATPRLSSSSA